MKPKYFSIIGVLAVAAASTPLLLPVAAQEPPPQVEAAAETDNENVQILTRGPVHEAFAEAVNSTPEPGFIVAKAPPSPIEELPPEQELEGDNVTWISGYWAWDDDQNDFLWISGVWRNIPPGRQWVPGYWSELADNQWQWTSGYWADSTTTEVDYVEEAPPATVDSGPNVEAPSEDHTWIPGNWRYAETRYVWSPGYWTPLRPDWTWVPSRWCWSPRGYSYIDGYWDYAIARRGILFAPVYFNRPVWAVPGYYYRPSVVVGFNVFNDHFWVRPRFGHYYFGDYYAPRYSGLGFFASHHWHGRRGCYDPIWAHNRWHHRHDHGWNDRIRDRYDFFRNNEDARPFRTWAAMRNFRGDRFSNDDRGRSRLFASSLDGFARNPVGGQRFRELNQERRNQFVQQRQQMRDFTRDRRQLEVAGRAANRDRAPDANRRAIAREQLRRSPVAGRDAGQLAGNQAPPRRPIARGAGNVRPDAIVRGGQRQGQVPQIGRGNRGGANRDDIARRDPRQGGNQAVPQANRGNRGPGQPGAATRENTSPRQQARPGPGRRADGTAQRQTPGRATPQQTPRRQQQVNPAPQQRRQQAAPQRQGPQRPQVAPTPQRRQQAAPQQRVQPRQQAAPQRRQQAAPQRQAPQRQAAPQRQQARPQARPAPQARPQARQAAPQRQQARPQARQAAPQRQQARPQARQAAPQRQQARPQARQAAPQRQQARPQARQAPQRQAAPQRQQARPQQRQAPQRQQQRQRSRDKTKADA